MMKSRWGGPPFIPVCPIESGRNDSLHGRVSRLLTGKFTSEHRSGWKKISGLETKTAACGECRDPINRPFLELRHTERRDQEWMDLVDPLNRSWISRVF